MCWSAPEPDTIAIPAVGVGVVVLGVSVSMLLIVVEPVTKRDPVTCINDADAKIKFDLLFASTPFPIIKADVSDDEMLYWPWTCW